jgi:hypothetical protein
MAHTLKGTRLRRWSAAFVIAAYSWIRLIPQSLPALHLDYFAKPPIIKLDAFTEFSSFIINPILTFAQPA